MIVQLGNKQLRISEDAKEVYLALGYSVVDESGSIVETGQATSLAEIKAENDTLKAELAKYQEAKEKLEKVVLLEEENVALKAEINALKEQLEAATKKGK